MHRPRRLPAADHETRLAEAGSHLARIVHELNAPASLIQGGLENLVEYLGLLLPHVAALEQRLAGQPDGPPAGAAVGVGYAVANVEGVLGICKESVQRLADLIAELHIWTGGPSRRLRLDPTPARALVDDAIRLAGARRVVRALLEREIPEELPQVLAHAESTGRALANVLGNAFDAVADCARPMVSIRARAVGPADGGMPAWVELRIRDNGPGIRPDDRESIFEPFFTTKQSGEGLGLGLAIARDTLRRGGGGLALGDADGVGAEFVIRLPVAPQNGRRAI
jgi:signal transduction histidine kinase